MKKVFLYCFLLVGLIISTTLPVYAKQVTNLPSVKITPDSFYYPLKRLSEKIMVYLYIDSSSKSDYYKSLVQTRLAELSHVVDKEYLDQVERSSQRLSYQVGILTDYIVGKKLDNKKQALIDLFKEDKIILEKLRDKYPANSSFWMLVQHVINSIDLNLQKL